MDGSAGYSEETARKQEHFRYFVQVHLAIVAAIYRKRPAMGVHYSYIDLNAGPGIVDGKPGSPMIFAEEALLSGVPWQAIFCEQDADSADTLREFTSAAEFHDPLHRHRLGVLEGDHRLGVKALIAAVKEAGGTPFGLIYADPNGAVLPIEVLSELCRAVEFEKVDVLCYVSATNYKRFRRVWKQRPRLTEDLAKVGKRYIYVRQPYRQHQWCFVFLTNWSGYPEIKKMGFYRSDSALGAAILDRLDRTDQERSGQQEIDWT